MTESKEERSLLKKTIVGIPLLTLALLLGLIISVNLADSDSPIVHEEIEEKEPKVLEMSRDNPANPKAHWFQPEGGSSGDPKDLVMEVHAAWHNLSIEEQYTTSPDSESYQLIASVVRAVNKVSSNIDSSLTVQFDAFQETAHQLTSPVIELTEEERRALIPRFDSQLNSLYEIMMNRP